MPEPVPGAGGRVLSERSALALAERGVRWMSVRFSPTVHGDALLRRRGALTSRTHSAQTIEAKRVRRAADHRGTTHPMAGPQTAHDW